MSLRDKVTPGLSRRTDFPLVGSKAALLIIDIQRYLSEPQNDEEARKKDPEDQKPPRHVGLTPEEQGILKVRRQDVWIWERRMERFQPMAQSVYDGPTGKPVPNSRKLRVPKKLDPNKPIEVSILGGGSLEAPLEPVTPGVLSAVAEASDADEWSLSLEPRKRRLELAQWIASEDNTLTARSLVNRFSGVFGLPAIAAWRLPDGISMM